jgi:oligopeptide transport system permease protein
MHSIPGDPFIGDRVIPEEVLKTLYAYYGLDLPVWVQYGRFLKELLCGDLGISLVYQGRSVNQFIQESFPISMRLGLQALSIAIPLGLSLGSLAAYRRSRWQDHLAMILSTIGVSVPNFVLASLLQLVFAVELNWLPVARWGSFAHTILPSIALAALPTAFIARLTRSNMVEVLEQDYIKMAYAKGLSPFRILLHHALPNALLPILSYVGAITAQIVTGSFMIERIFAIPGLGQWMILSIHGRDYPMVIGLTVFFSTLLMGIMWLIELLYCCIDPKINLRASP